MKAMKWMGWSGLVLLAASLMWTTGCGGGDDNGGTTTIVVTNAAGDVTTVVVTNAPAAPALVAPQLVTPENNREYNVLLLLGTKYKVNFEWTAVPGAQSYVLELDGVQNAINGTTAELELGYGTYKWRVWAKDANGASGPASGKFTVVIAALMAFPVGP
jgi:hypothetical protein